MLFRSNLLHIGIGNNLFYHLFKSKTKITGITYSILEYEKALKFRDNNYEIILLNKYNPELENIINTYDYIIDNNICSYRCCELHAVNYFKTIINKLNDNGKILSDLAGWHYKFKDNIPIDLESICNFVGAKYTIIDKVIILEKK